MFLALSTTANRVHRHPHKRPPTSAASSTVRQLPALVTQQFRPFDDEDNRPVQLSRLSYVYFPSGDIYKPFVTIKTCFLWSHSLTYVNFSHIWNYLCRDFTALPMHVNEEQKNDFGSILDLPRAPMPPTMNGCHISSAVDEQVVSSRRSPSANSSCVAVAHVSSAQSPSTQQQLNTQHTCRHCQVSGRVRACAHTRVCTDDIRRHVTVLDASRRASVGRTTVAMRLVRLHCARCLLIPCAFDTGATLILTPLVHKVWFETSFHY
jgi:hypothetical protein